MNLINLEPNKEKPKSEKRLLRRGPGYVRDKLQGKRFLIPSCITVVGIFCGLLAVIAAFKGNIEYGVRCVGLAIILDGLDGRVARHLNATSEFGKEFDSLSDMTAFGLAPAMLVYSWVFASTADEVGALIAFIFVVCGATRLARFNISTEDKPKAHFRGLPIPGAAGALASLIYCFPELTSSIFHVALVSIYMLLISFLMVSNLPFFSVKRIKININPQSLLVALSILIALIWYNSRVMLFVVGTTYAMSGLIGYVFSKLRRVA